MDQYWKKTTVQSGNVATIMTTDRIQIMNIRKEAGGLPTVLSIIETTYWLLLGLA